MTRPKTVQIPEALFLDLLKWHCSEVCQTQERADRIRQGLQAKLDSMAARDLYSVMHDSTKTPQEREQARREYLDRVGVPDAFRW